MLQNAGATKFRLTASFASGTCTVTMNEARSGRKVYCIITDASGNQVKSKEIALYMRQPLKITSQPQDITASMGRK